MFARPRPAPFTLSVLTHGFLLAWVASGPAPEESKSLYTRVIAPHASKLVWYNFREKLPDVSPAAPRADAKPPRAEFKIASQEIVAGSANAPHARQFIWQPAPKLELQQDLRSPNVVALRAPQIDPPPKPKLFAPPPETPRAAVETPALAPPPQLQAAAVPAQSPIRAVPATPARPQPKAFTPPPEAKKPGPAAPQLDAPPEIRVARNLGAAAAIGNVLGEKPAKLQPRAFVAPRAGQGGRGNTPALPAPPRVEAAASLGSAAQPLNGGKPSPFGPPLPEAPPGSASDISMAIVGLDPSASATVPAPDGSRNAQFSAGPHLRPDGGMGGSGEGAMLTVPGLMIRNSDLDARPTLMARVPPTATSNLRAAVRSSLPDPSAAEMHPAAIRVSSAPDPWLAGRPIYEMSVQMPNITSYSGSWLIWFAERTPELGAAPSIGQRGPVSAPVPLRKVDPKYLPSAIADRVEGTVRLAAVIRIDGHVDSVRLLRHLDDRLDESAAQAIDKWEFQPARRNGKPVDVDAVIEIPFRLAPKVAH